MRNSNYAPSGRRPRGRRPLLVTLAAFATELHDGGGVRRGCSVWFRFAEVEFDFGLGSGIGEVPFRAGFPEPP